MRIITNLQNLDLQMNISYLDISANVEKLKSYCEAQGKGRAKG